MLKSKHLVADASLSDTPAEKLYTSSWITDRAWICGLAGAITVIICGYWFNSIEAFSKGVYIWGRQITDNRIDSSLLALALCTLVMISVEGARLFLRDSKTFIKLDPDISSGRYLRFVTACLFNYLLYLALLTLVIAFYQAANEYGFSHNEPYYQPWFRFLDLAWTAYLWAGFPYVLLTRALKFDPLADQRDLTRLFSRTGMFFLSLLPALANMRPQFDEMDKKIARGLLVKLFFTPLMTVFFCDQFQHLIPNIAYVLDALPEAVSSGQYTHIRFNRDLFNISMSLIFSIDVALAWCGYVIATRWLDNQTISAEPTMLGWIVCVICYPPFQHTLGLYFSIPGDQSVLSIGNHWLVSIFTIMMVLSYFIYMSATLWFGVRFSNLTNRGIIRRGPFAFVRHPAYASKNFAWWCVMFPFVIYSIPETGLGTAFSYVLGLCFMTGFYYLRALTEERHLLADPYYQEYCKQVKYRFIPRVI